MKTLITTLLSWLSPIRPPRALTLTLERRQMFCRTPEPE